MEGVIEGDTDEPQSMGDDSIEVTEEKADEAMNKRGEAMAAMNDGNLEEAIKLFTEAIEMNPHLAMLFAKRARYVWVCMAQSENLLSSFDKGQKVNQSSLLSRLSFYLLKILC